MNSVVKLSRRLSYLLRHCPESANLHMDPHGYVLVSELLQQCPEYTDAILKDIVETDDKRRYSFSDDGLRIRANQGHSFSVDLNLVPQTPPDVLYHGTVSKFVDSIMETGLRRQSRQYVHLSTSIETAKKVGGRRGEPVILKINANRINHDGYTFYVSENGVWLTDYVPTQYILKL